MSLKSYSNSVVTLNFKVFKGNNFAGNDGKFILAIYKEKSGRVVAFEHFTTEEDAYCAAKIISDIAEYDATEKPIFINDLIAEMADNDSVNLEKVQN